jgi:hypothetical protein
MSTIGHARPSNRAKTRWEIKYAINRKTQYATIDAKSEREALAEIARRVTAGVALSGSAKTTLGDYLPRWLESLDLRPVTRANYASVVRTYLAPDLGGYRLRELKPSAIRAAFIKWHAAGAARSWRPPKTWQFWSARDSISLVRDGGGGCGDSRGFSMLRSALRNSRPRAMPWSG